MSLDRNKFIFLLILDDVIVEKQQKTREMAERCIINKLIIFEFYQ